jgi:hypothetical protein
MMRATRFTFSLAAAALIAGVSAASAQVEYKPAQGTPKHAVIIFIDGFRADLLDPSSRRTSRRWAVPARASPMPRSGFPATPCRGSWVR